MKLSVFGLGYVGTVSAGCLAHEGHEVIGVDAEPTKVDLINAGKSPIIEKDIGRIIEQQVATGRLSATTDADVAVQQTDLQLREHYLIERELADRLRSAPRQERGALYSELYDELFRRVPHHPMLHAVDLPQREHEIARPLRFLRSFLTCESVLMEIGAGDCALAMRAASLAKQVYAIDVSEEITRSVAPPGNFKLILSDGCSIPVPEGGIDVAFSNQLMEHLHPEDAGEQLRNIHRSLAPGGTYVCHTPNRLYGPHDISKHFDEIATGFHLREYTARDIRNLFVDAGFAEVRFYASARGRFLHCPYWAIAALESALGALPYSLRKRLADTTPMRAVLGLWVAAIKPHAG